MCASSDSGRQAKHGEAAGGNHHSKKKRGQQDDSGSYNHPEPAFKRRRREAEVQLPKQVEEKVKRKPGRPRKHPKPDAAPLTTKVSYTLFPSSTVCIGFTQNAEPVSVSKSALHSF